MPSSLVLQPAAPPPAPSSRDERRNPPVASPGDPTCTNSQTCASTALAAASPCPGSGGEAATQARTHTTALQVVVWPSQPHAHPQVVPWTHPRAQPHAHHPPSGILRERACPPNRVGIHRRLWRGSSRIPCPSACPTCDRVRSGIQTCTVRSQMSQSDVPIQNSQYVALFDDFCILVAPET